MLMQTTRTVSFFVFLLAGTCLVASAQDKTAIQQKLTSQYALTKTTADKSDIVTAGAILVLKKDNLVMVDVTSSNFYQNTYRDGKITQNALKQARGGWNAFKGIIPGASAVPAVPSSGAAQRTFVAGEKMWVTDIEVKDNGVRMQLYTDAINNIRYGAALNFPFKGSAPIDQQTTQQMIAEVFDVQPSDDSSGNGVQQAAAPANAPQQAPTGGQAQQADAVPPPIPPPPPPADEPPPAPKTISLGQTKDVVIANFGQPDKIAEVGTKEIYYYKDLKVTFVKGKVSDVE